MATRSNYYLWLLSRCDISDRRYHQLFQLLYYTPFLVIMPMDQNRIDDCHSLRNEYLLDLGKDDDDLPNVISVLEVLLMLAIRLDEEYYGDPSNPNPGGLFWLFLHNLDLDSFEDRYFNRSVVNDILDVWMSRKFRPDGVGSIFPLQHPYGDQRHSQLWDQAQAYFSEN